MPNRTVSNISPTGLATGRSRVTSAKYVLMGQWELKADHRGLKSRGEKRESENFFSVEKKKRLKQEWIRISREDMWV